MRPELDGLAVTMDLTDADEKADWHRIPGWIFRTASTFDRVACGIEIVAMSLSALAIAVTTLIVCAEVILRSGFGISTLISAEYAGYLLAATVYLGMAWTFRSGGFIRVDLIHGTLRGRVAAIANFAIAAFATATLVVYTYYIFGHVMRTEQSGATSIYITRTPLWMPMVVMPVGCVLLTWAMFATMVRAAVTAIWPDAPVSQETHEAEDWL